MADALHNTNDAGALLIAYIARRIAKKGADEKFTFGYKRAELIGAMIQLTALIVVGLYLIYESTRRFFEPQLLQSSWIMAAAGGALVVDLVTVWLLRAMSKGSLNVKAAFLHNLTDAGASVAVLAGGAAIYWLNWSWVDSALTLIIAGYILFMSFGMLNRTSRILMEGTPPEINIAELVNALETISGIESVHHIHVWELNEHNMALEAHIVIQQQSDVEMLETIKSNSKTLLKDRFKIEHSTLEIERYGSECNTLLCH